MQDKKFHRIAVLASPVIMDTESTSALDIANCSWETDESSSKDYHSILVWLPEAYSNEDNVVMTVVHVKTQIIPVNQS